MHSSKIPMSYRYVDVLLLEDGNDDEHNEARSILYLQNIFSNQILSLCSLPAT